jgi:isopentenyldiphosphate isomerase
MLSMSYSDPNELFDVLDDQGNPTGEQKPRALVHRDGDWHRSFHLWIIKDGQYVLFQRRSKEKDLESGKIDVTVGGHFAVGESFVEVVREIEEEVGLRVKPSELHFLNTRKVERWYDHALDREFVETYVLRCDQALNQYHLTCEEVTVLYEIPLEKAIELYRNGTFVAANGFDCQQRTNNALLVEEDLIQQSKIEVVEVLESIQTWLSQPDLDQLLNR